MDLLALLRELIARLEDAPVPYALCGGLALAVHGEPRATMGIDLLVQEESLPTIKALAGALGFTLEAAPMSFQGGGSPNPSPFEG